MRDIWEAFLATGRGAIEILVQDKILETVVGDELLDQIRKLMADNPNVVAEIKSGKEKAKGFFVGKVMKAAEGKANPQEVRLLIDQVLSE